MNGGGALYKYGALLIHIYMDGAPFAYRGGLSVYIH